MGVCDGAHWLFVMKKTAVDSDDILARTSLSILYQKKGMVPEDEAEVNSARVLGVRAGVEEREWISSERDHPSLTLTTSPLG